MRSRVLVASVFFGLTLACGGGVGGSAVGPYATSMAQHYESENPGIPCPTYNVGEEITVADFTYRVDEVLLVDAEASLPWISNSDERRAFGKEGVRALVVRHSIRNNTPVKKALDVWFGVTSTDGESLWWQPYNAKLFKAEHGIEDRPDQLPPNTWVQTVGVMAIEAAYADGAVGRVYYEVEEYDPTDPRGRRKIDVLYEQAVVDLGTPTEGPHINPERRDGATPAAAPAGGGRPRKTR